MVFLCAAFFTACAPASNTIALLIIDAPHDATTGDEINVIVYGHAMVDGTPVGLVVTGKNGPQSLQSTFSEGSAQFTIPAEYTQHRGYVALIAASGEAHGEASILLNSQTLIASVEEI